MTMKTLQNCAAIAVSHWIRVKRNVTVRPDISDSFDRAFRAGLATRDFTEPDRKTASPVKDVTEMGSRAHSKLRPGLTANVWYA